MCSIVSIVLLFITSLQEKIVLTASSTFQVLNGMHEGLLILSKVDNGVMFTN